MDILNRLKLLKAGWMYYDCKQYNYSVNDSIVLF